MAGAVGAMLVLALLVSLLAHEAHVGLPRQGAEAERAWSEGLLAAALATASAATGAPGPVALDVPPPAPAPSLGVPLLGRAWGAPASGAVAFDPACGRVDASHAVRGARVVDLAGVPTGCLTLRLDPAYGKPAAYVVELGGVVVRQPEGAVVAAGPPLEIRLAPDGSLRVALALASLQGPGGAVGVGAGGARVEIAPSTASPETAAGPNAGNLTWTFETRHPAAWKDWLDARLAEAGVPASGTPPQAVVACDAADCATGPSGAGRVTLFVEGPGTQGEDVTLALSHRAARVNVR